MKNKVFCFGQFEITVREILASISIIAVMVMVGMLISGEIEERQVDANEKYNKALRIDSEDLFQYGMETNVGNAFVYGDLEAVDTVSYPEISGEYMYVEKVKERYERHEKTVTVEDKNGNKHKETKVEYRWEINEIDRKYCNEIMFLGITFPCDKIAIPSSSYIETIKGEKEWSWKSGEKVKVRYKYYGTEVKHSGTIFAVLKDGTISGNTPFYKNKNIDETLDYLKSGGGAILFWVFWAMLICGCVVGFCYLDNKWLE